MPQRSAPSFPQPQNSVPWPLTARICSRENAAIPPKNCCAQALVRAEQSILHIMHACKVSNHHAGMLSERCRVMVKEGK